ncbi:DUF4147 domain-containing protein [Candidatus Bathyarchaeota archaeon]|nr:glycerate kinase [Candidatus Bathyarchaeota archaeon]NIU80791.1 DUF4147 domain-containing protein [Candidatus Bathyarchaeota archaeon]NIV67416.1 DUF4147 domain-containing protein [Candidatus Bathyarchaeota archaeon]NIW15960.1 DUF4147 domain-containing protein [Candidatus Bathyarchaeota archaeon]NIW34062.1 DUF4147 domain-containing protein [Candidatus Bathyarchaeota archaeon]
MQIFNKSKIVNNGHDLVNKRARRYILEAFETALAAVDPQRILRSELILENSMLMIKNASFDLDSFENTFVVGAGKAVGFMAKALEELLLNRITAGIVVVPHGTQSYGLHKMRIVEASHPLPDESSGEAAASVMDITERVGNEDLVICLISGGGSSLLCSPPKGITISEKRELTSKLLRSGATIEEINAVRKHLSQIKGGRLARKCYPATILNLVISDVMGDRLDTIASGPTSPDPTTFKDAIGVIKNYKLWRKTPTSIRSFLSDGKDGLVDENPKPGEEVFGRVHSFVLANNRTACLAACRELKKRGVNTLLLTSQIEGEARYVGSILAAIAQEIVSSDHPIPTPAAVVVGGETSVTVTGKGRGGRNQEIALSASLKLQHSKRVVIGSINTDGIDGVAPAAGAVADCRTIQRARKQGLSGRDFLQENNSYEFFSRLGDAIVTGATETNVNDISIVLVLEDR